MNPLTWTDAQGDRCTILAEDLCSVSPTPIVAAIEMFSDGSDDLAVWLTRENAESLRDWLNERLAA